jgi:hypothetical protein
MSNVTNTTAVKNQLFRAIAYAALAGILHMASKETPVFTHFDKIYTSLSILSGGMTVAYLLAIALGLDLHNPLNKDNHGDGI